jgi:MoaA/NifB/PqqE/SkfB family radical SAM enzyme
MVKSAYQQRQHGSIATSVAQELAEHPDLSSEMIATRLQLSKKELLDCYEAIQNDRDLQRIIIEESESPRLTMEASDLITRHADYLTRILTGSEVYPLILEFHPGPVCNSQCTFCFSNNWKYGEYLNNEKPISAERVEQIFDECRANGVEEIWFSGGKEPFVNHLTPKYIQTANEKGFRTRLYTNGIAMVPKAHESILGCYQIRISVNGVTPVTYNRIQFPELDVKQAKDILDRVLNNISDLVKSKKERHSNIRIGMSQILQPDNHHEMVEFVKLGQKLGVDSVHFRLEAMGVVRDFSEAEKDTMRAEIVELQKDGAGLEIDIRGVAEGEFESRQTQFLPKLKAADFCRAGMLKRGMNPYGGLYYCEFSSHPRFRIVSSHLRLGDTREENIGEILRRNAGKYPSPCTLCQAHEYGLNITLEKLEQDLQFGIPIDKQPYYRKDNQA